MFADLPSGVRGWVGALSAGAVLAVMGFIARLSVQQFLGIDTGSWGAEDLGLFAGHWAADTLTVTLQQLFSHPLTLGVPLVAFLSPTLLLAVLPAEHKLARRLTFLSTGLSVAGLAIVLWWCEMPTVQMNNWLTTSLQDQIPGHLPGSERVSDMRLTRLVSAMDGIADHGQTTCAEVSERDRKSETVKYDPPVLQKRLMGARPATAARQTLEIMYTCTVLACIAAWFSFSVHASADEPKLIDEIFRGMRLVVLLAMLPIAGCFVPYMYGRLIYSTSLPIVTVFFKHAKEAAPSEQKPARPPSTSPSSTGRKAKMPPASQSVETVPPPPNLQYLLVDLEDKDVALISIKDDPPALQRWPREAIDHLEQFGTRDAFNEILYHCNWLPEKERTAGKPQ